MNPAEAVGAIANEANVPFLLDACQSVGQLKLDVSSIGCDMLTGTGRKFLRGRRGTGFLYVRESLANQLEPPFLDLHAATWIDSDRYQIRHGARRSENWEGNVAGKIGLGVAVDYALEWGIGAIERRVSELASDLRRRLDEIDGVMVRDQGFVDVELLRSPLTVLPAGRSKSAYVNSRSMSVFRQRTMPHTTSPCVAFPSWSGHQCTTTTRRTS